VGMPPAAWRLAAVVFLMSCLWITQAMPMAAVSLIPLVAFPLLGIQAAKEVSGAYIDENVFLFLGGFVIALGIEKWGLHKRMALHIIRVLGTGPRRVVLGFMAATGFLSMWISNTASTVLMLPIGLALVASIRELSGEPGKRDATSDRFATVLMIAIAYGASIGGLTTLVGTPTNVQFLGIWSKQFPAGKYPDVPTISAGEWMFAVFPIGLLLLLCAWGLLSWRLPSRLGEKPLQRSFFTDRLRALGPMAAAERRMLVIFVVTACLWVFRKPLTFDEMQLLPGWGNELARFLARFRPTSDWGVKPAMLHDSTVAIGMALLMFAIPAGRSDEGKPRMLMDWNTANKLPWGILLLFGGGFAIAGAFQSTELADWLGNEFAAVVGGWQPWLLVAAVCLLLTFLTELTSNVATVSTLLPVLAATAKGIGVDPRLIMIPATISASCAFMLPIATPPNAIVFGSGKVRMSQMANYGLALNLIGVVVVTLGTFTLIAPLLGIPLDGLPAWLR
jgi:solute carrier family 13 (sodium-dependent dicarboxylate transporter), member 2/3/5